MAAAYGAIHHHIPGDKGGHPLSEPTETGGREIKEFLDPPPPLRAKF